MRTPEASKKAVISLLSTVREYRANDQTKTLVAMLDAMVENYQSRLLDCPDAEIQKLRISGKQLMLLRAALTDETLDRISLTV